MPLLSQLVGRASVWDRGKESVVILPGILGVRVQRQPKACALGGVLSATCSLGPLSRPLSRLQSRAHSVAPTMHAGFTLSKLVSPKPAFYAFPHRQAPSLLPTSLPSCPRGVAAHQLHGIC